MGTFIDAKFQMNGASFGAYVKTELATTRGFDLLFHCFFPFVLDVEDEYTLLDDTKATPDTGDTEPKESFSMGKDQPGSKAMEICRMLPPTSLLREVGLHLATSLFSSVLYSPYMTESPWKSVASSGDWAVFSEQRAAGLTASIGKLSIRYCGQC
jgi:hypothetical protein